MPLPTKKLRFDVRIKSSSWYLEPIVNETRYGFVITDTHRVPLRLTRQATTSGLAQGRGRRQTTIHQRYTSDSTMASSSSYQDDDPLTWEFCNPEYAIIPWGSHGNGRLTVKLALWCLAMMATNGDRWIDYSYPSLDSWRGADKGYVHNTSGATKKRLFDGDSYQEPDPDRARREVPREQMTPEAGVTSQHDYTRPPGSQAIDPMPQSSQPRVSLNEAISQDPSATTEEGVNSGDVNEAGDQNDGKVVVSSRRSGRRKEVRVQRHALGRKNYFVNASGSKVDTTKREWKRVEDGYELQGQRHVYFTREFP